MLCVHEGVVHGRRGGHPVSPAHVRDPHPVYVYSPPWLTVSSLVVTPKIVTALCPRIRPCYSLKIKKNIFRIYNTEFICAL